MLIQDMFAVPSEEKVLTEKRGAAVLIHCSSRSTQSASVACDECKPHEVLPNTHFLASDNHFQFSLCHRISVSMSESSWSPGLLKFGRTQKTKFKSEASRKSPISSTENH